MSLTVRQEWQGRISRLQWLLNAVITVECLCIPFFAAGAVVGMAWYGGRRLGADWGWLAGISLSAAVLFLAAWGWMRLRGRFFSRRDAAAQWMNPGWAPPSLSVAESYASLKAAVDTGNFWVMARENLTVGQWASLAWGIEAGRLMQAPGLFLLGFVLGRQDFFLQNDGNAVFWTRGLLLSLAGAVAFYVVMSLPGLPAPLHTVFSM